MKTSKIIALCAIGAFVLSSCCGGMTTKETQPAGITSSEVDSVSYMIGYSFGMSLKQNDFGSLSYNQIVKGMKAAFADVEIGQEQFYNIVNSFMEKRKSALAEANKAASEKFFEENGKKEGVITTASGLQYKIVRDGNGVKPTAVDKVEVNYEGTLLDGKVFDSSYERGESVTFGLNQVIRGWSEGLQLVDEGGEIELWIPADLAYGEQGAGSKIGPGAALKFRVELIKVMPAEESAEEE